MLGTPSQTITPVTGNYTALITDDAIVSSASSASTVTLYAAQGNFGGYAYTRQQNPGVIGGLLWIINAGTAVITIAPAGSDAVYGPLSVGPGAAIQLFCDGSSHWYATAAGASSAVALQVQIPITSANILAMYAVPVQLIAAPGAANAIIVDSVTTKIVTTSTQYANGGAVIYQYDSTVHGAGVNAASSTIPAATINAAAGTAINQQGPAVAANGTVVPLNKGLFISNATGAFDTGTGTAVANIRYRILTP